MAGLVRPDLISLDLGLLIQLVSRAGSGGRPELAQRYLVLVLAAIRVERDPAGALRCPAPSRAMRAFPG